MLRYLPFLDLRAVRPEDLRRDLQAALAVTFLSVPQGVAYAVIAGLPPAMGLYAGAVPAVVGSLFRSSRHVVSGPSNAVSLLVGTAVAAQAGDPVTAAVTLAFIVGALQLAAGLLSLGALVDYISSAVVLGYITGAGTLIAVGQLGHLTATPRGSGTLPEQLLGWARGLGGTDPRTVALGLGTAAGVALLGRYRPRFPAAILAMGVGIALSAWWGPEGMATIRDLAPVPAGLPPWSTPDLGRVPELLPAAVAVAVLSLVESSAVARALAARSGDRIDVSVEFAGQGLSNLAAALWSGYPISGSLGRSALNFEAGARTRLSGALGGGLVLVVLLFLGPVVDLTPVASLAGVLLVVAARLVDVPRIRKVLAAGAGDRWAFLGTVGGTWLLPLDQAIYLGVGISLVIFLRRARLLTVHELGIDGDRVRERHADDGVDFGMGPAVRALLVEGSLFFGAANELRDRVAPYLADPRVKAVVLRLKRARDLDYTTASVLEELHVRMAAEGRLLLLVGMRPRMMRTLRRTGVADALGEDRLFPAGTWWFEAMHAALRTARDHARAAGQDTARLDAYLARAAAP